VDAEGRPLVVYHGTNADFNTFDIKKATDKEGKKLNLGFGSKMFYFTPIKNIAKKYGNNLIEVYLDIKNIYDLNNKDNKADYRNAINGYKVDNIWYSEIPDKSNKRAEKFVSELKKKNFDGINAIDEIIVFSPTQIKSATGNDGSFDPNEPDIRYMRTHTGTIYGFVKNGVVYLNSNTPNLNTPIHEFGHLWIDAIEGSDLYNRGAELVKETPYWERVNADPNYSHLSENARAKEAMAMAIGDKGEAVKRNIAHLPV
jgi:hypothetical protein